MSLHQNDVFYEHQQEFNSEFRPKPRVRIKLHHAKALNRAIFELSLVMRNKELSLEAKFVEMRRLKNKLEKLNALLNESIKFCQEKNKFQIGEVSE